MPIGGYSLDQVWKKDFYDLFRDIGQTVVWYPVKRCPNSSATGRGHKRDCPICGGNGIIYGKAVSGIAIVDNFQPDKQVDDPGWWTAGDVTMGVPSMIPRPLHDGFEASPLLAMRLEDRVVVPHIHEYGRCTTVRGDDRVPGLPPSPTGDATCLFELTRVEAVVEDVLQTYVIGTDVEYDPHGRDLDWAAGAGPPDKTKIEIEYKRSARFVVYKDLPGGVGSGTLSLGVEGPRQFHLRLAEIWERGQGHR